MCPRTHSVLIRSRNTSSGCVCMSMCSPHQREQAVCVHMHVVTCAFSAKDGEAKTTWLGTHLSPRLCLGPCSLCSWSQMPAPGSWATARLSASDSQQLRAEWPAATSGSGLGMGLRKGGWTCWPPQCSSSCFLGGDEVWTLSRKEISGLGWHLLSWYLALLIYGGNLQLAVSEKQSWKDR